MTTQLPPLNSLRAFEAAARRLSFRDAAEELHVTPSAVSQRIRLLEEQIGTPLFQRLTRAIALTEAGEILARDLGDAFAIVSQSLSRINHLNEKNTLTISTTMTFAERWLLPRLPHFNDQFPDLDVRVFSGDALVDFKTDGTDLAIRFGRGDYSELIAEQLTAEKYYPVCSPQLLEHADRPLNKPADLLNHTLIETHWPISSEAAPTWKQCLKNSGLNYSHVKKTLGFSVETLSLHAAIDGLGIALGHDMLIERDLANGTLIKPFGSEVFIDPQFRFYVVYPRAAKDDNKILHFRNWLFEQVDKQAGKNA